MSSKKDPLDELKDLLDQLSDDIDGWNEQIASFEARDDKRKVTRSAEDQLRELVLVNEEMERRIDEVRGAFLKALDRLGDDMKGGWGKLIENYKKARTRKP